LPARIFCFWVFFFRIAFNLGFFPAFGLRLGGKTPLLFFMTRQPTRSEGGPACMNNSVADSKPRGGFEPGPAFVLAGGGHPRYPFFWAWQGSRPIYSNKTAKLLNLWSFISPRGCAGTFCNFFSGPRPPQGNLLFGWKSSFCPNGPYSYPRDWTFLRDLLIFWNLRCPPSFFLCGTHWVGIVGYGPGPIPWGWPRGWSPTRFFAGPCLRWPPPK